MIFSPQWKVLLLQRETVTHSLMILGLLKIQAKIRKAKFDKMLLKFCFQNSLKSMTYPKDRNLLKKLWNTLKVSLNKIRWIIEKAKHITGTVLKYFVNFEEGCAHLRSKNQIVLKIWLVKSRTWIKEPWNWRTQTKNGRAWKWEYGP